MQEQEVLVKLYKAFNALSDTAEIYWVHGKDCPLRYNVNLPDPCTCGVDDAANALHDALTEREVDTEG